jgi:hypothetical protein
MSSKPVSLPSQNKPATTPEKNTETKTVTLAKTGAPKVTNSGSNNNTETAAVYDELLTRIDQLFYTDPARGKNNNISSKIRSGKDSQFNIRFQTTRDEEGKEEPKCRLPFGIAEPFDKNDKTGLKDLHLSIETQGLEMFFKKLDENNIRVAHANSPKWFKKQLTIEQVRDMYKSTIRYDTKAEEKKRQAFKPTIKTKVAVDSNDKTRQSVQIIEYVGKHPTDPTKKIFKHFRGSWKSIEKHTQTIAIVEISSLWFMPKEFGMSLRTVSLILYPVNKNVPAFNMGKGQNCVIMDDSEIPQELSSPAATTAPGGPPVDPDKADKIIVVKQD